MELTLRNDDTGIDIKDVRAVVQTALIREAALARARRDVYLRACNEFERRFGMSSKQFMDDFEDGVLGDEIVYFDWYAAKRGLDQWDRRMRILSEVAL